MGFFDRGQYVRFLRTASETQDHVTIVSLGPFYDTDYDSQGPTSYFWDANEEVIFEEGTAIIPKLETAADPTGDRVTLGSVVLSKENKICLLCRSARGMRALVDLSSGELVKNEKAMIFYRSYVLILADAFHGMRVAFDSSKHDSGIFAAA